MESKSETQVKINEKKQSEKTIERKSEKTTERKSEKNEGNGNLSDDMVNVAIDPDVKANRVNVQICSCSFILNCFTD